MENKITSIWSVHIFGDIIQFHIYLYTYINVHLLYVPDEILLESFRAIFIFEASFIKCIYLYKHVVYSDRFGIPSSIKMNY